MTNIYRQRKKTILITGLAFSILTGVACHSEQGKGLIVETGNSVTEQDKTTVLKKMTPKEQLDFSKQDLAKRLGLEVDTIKVSGATPVNWRSGALGCPKPGVNYMDVLVPGIRIIFRVGNEIYRYHAIPNGQPFYCPNDRAESPAAGPGAD